MKTVVMRVCLYAALGGTAILGGVSLLATGAFLFAGPFDLLDLSMQSRTALAWDALLSLAFFLQHSGMVRRPFRRKLGRFLSPHFHGALYTVASGVVLLAVVVLWQDSGQSVATAHGVFRYLMRGIFFLSMLGMAWGFLALRAFDSVGLNALRDYARGTSSPEVPFTVRGPYRWVRHPLYALTLVAIWSCPDLTLDRLLFNGLWTGWIIIGTTLEERDLVADFGEQYRDYQRRVPMLIPYRMNRH